MVSVRLILPGQLLCTLDCEVIALRQKVPTCNSLKERRNRWHFACVSAAWVTVSQTCRSETTDTASLCRAPGQPLPMQGCTVVRMLRTPGWISRWAPT